MIYATTISALVANRNDEKGRFWTHSVRSWYARASGKGFSGNT